MNRLRSLFEEIHHRGLWQAAIAFLGTAWALLQVIDLFTSRGLLPDWTFNGVLVALGLGFPVVMATAYVQTPATKDDPNRPTDPTTQAPLDPDAPRRLADFLTWRRAFLGGAAAFALLGIGTAVYGVMRVTGIGSPGTLVAQGVIEQGGLVVLADFESSAGTSVPSDLVTEALRIDLQQSTTFELMHPRAVGAALERMVRTPDEPLSETVALELAIREGAELVVTGDVGRLGSGYIVAARILGTEDGSVLGAFRETAADSTELIAALDDLSAAVRSKMGESLRSVAATEPLGYVTTRSLDALRKFSFVAQREPRGAITQVRAQEVIEEAIALDSTFAQAHGYLAVLITNAGGSAQRRLEASAAAFRHREHLPRRDRLSLEGVYHNNVSGDYAAAGRAYRGLLEEDPTDVAATVNLGDILMYSGNYADAEQVLRAHPSLNQGTWRFNLAAALAGQQRFAEAMEQLDEFHAQNPGLLYEFMAKGLLLLVQGEAGLARERMESEPVTTQYPFSAWRELRAAIVPAWEGRLIEAERHAESSLDLFENVGATADGMFWGVTSSLITGWMGRDAVRATADLDALLARFATDETAGADLQLGAVALGYAALGATPQSTATLERLGSQPETVGDPEGKARAAMARALVRVHQGDEAGITEFERATRLLRCVRCADFYLGIAYEAAGQRSDAIDAYSRYLGSGFFDIPRHVLTVPGSVVHERLGILYEAAADSANAITHYAEFARLWAVADPDQLPRVQHAEERILALGGQIPLN